ncbi:MAG: ABC transporter ATP-binding protein [Canibacter sp.]
MKDIWTTLWQLFAVLPKGAKGYYVLYSIFTSLLASLDIVALGLIASLITPIASGGDPHLPLVGEVSQSQLPWLILLICVLFVTKSLLAIFLHWRATRRFAKYELEVGNKLFKSYTHSNWESRSQLSTAEITRIVDSSMANTNLGFILALSQLPNNLVTFLAMFVVLIFAEPMSALVAVVYLGLVSLLMLLVITKRAKQAGRVNREYAYKVATIMTEMVDALKEVTLRNKLNEVGEVVSGYRRVATRARANMSFLGIVPRYSLDAALIGGFLIIGGISFLFGGLSAALVSVAMFAATGFRMIPAMNNVQASFTNASANIVYARDIIRELKRAETDQAIQTIDRVEKEYPTSPKVLRLENLSYRYPGTDHDVLKNINLEIPFGSRVGIVGPSGAGKSTLVDIILGLSTPTAGQVAVDGTPIDQILKQWRSQVGYVPQRVTLFNASIAQNVALTWTDDYEEHRVVDALERAQLSELIVDRAGGLNERVGERGVSISGGQQQRLGIARALYSNPEVLVFDEATSALDTGTESRVTQAMDNLAGQVTFITIAHRLSTIKEYDMVCYFDHGELLGAGSFEELQKQVPDFAIQAGLAGLGDTTDE